MAREVQVDGNIQAENAAQVSIIGRSRVEGNVQIKQSGGATVLNSRINGDLQFDDNTRALASENNYIGGNLQAFQNRGGLRVFSNRIDGNLQCKANRPAPTGRANIVRGIKADQCDRL